MKIALLLYIALTSLVLTLISKVKSAGIEKDVSKLCKDVIDTASHTGVSFRFVCNVGNGFVEFGGEKIPIRTTYAVVSSYGWRTS